MSDVFISYSRQNSDFARRLITSLYVKSKDAWVDWEDIQKATPNWWAEIKAGIEAADSFVFIMSPHSMASVVCNMELDYAFALQKRIIPVVYIEVNFPHDLAPLADFEPDPAMMERLEGNQPQDMAEDNWGRLSHINWVFFRESDDFDDAFSVFITTVETDLEYVKAHTRYLTRAQEWDREQRREEFLLFGDEIIRAEAWLKAAEAFAAAEQPDKVDIVNPLPQDIHRDYIQSSRQAADERARHLQELETSRIRSEAAAQQAREETQQAERARRNARRTLLVVAIVSALLIVGAVIFTVARVNDAQGKVEIASTEVGQAQQQVAYANATLTPIVATSVASNVLSDYSNGVSLYNLGAYEFARDNFRAALPNIDSLEPSLQPALHTNLLKACLRLRDYECAETAGLDALAIDPLYTETYYVLAQTYRALGRFDDAENTLDEMQTAYETNGDTDRLYPLGEYYIGKLRAGLAVDQEAWETAITIGEDTLAPETPVLWRELKELLYYLATSYQELGQTEKACEYWQQYATTPLTSPAPFGEPERDADAQERIRAICDF